MSAETKIHESALRAVQENPDRESWTDGVRGHVSSCSSCQSTLEASLRLRVGLKHSQGAKAPADLLARVQSRLHEESGRAEVTAPTRRSAPWTSRAWAPVALAAGLVLGIGIGTTLRSGSPPDGPVVVDGEVVSTVGDYLADVTHDRYLLERTGRPIERASRDSSELSTWLSQGTGFDVSLGRQPAEWRLSGGRVWHTVSRISALAEYDRGNRRVTVFAVPAAGIASDSFEEQRVGKNLWVHEAWSFRGVAWYEGALIWSAVSDLPEDELVSWVREYRGR